MFEGLATPISSDDERRIGSELLLLHLRGGFPEHVQEQDTGCSATATAAAATDRSTTTAAAAAVASTAATTTTTETTSTTAAANACVSCSAANIGPASPATSTAATNSAPEQSCTHNADCCCAPTARSCEETPRRGSGSGRHSKTTAVGCHDKDVRYAAADTVHSSSTSGSNSSRGLVLE